MEVTSPIHVSTNGKQNLGHFSLHIGLVGAVEADGTQPKKLTNFLELARNTLMEICESRPTDFPIVRTDEASGTTIEVYFGSQSVPTTKLRKDDPKLAVVTEWAEK